MALILKYKNNSVQFQLEDYFPNHEIDRKEISSKREFKRLFPRRKQTKPTNNPKNENASKKKQRQTKLYEFFEELGEYLALKIILGVLQFFTGRLEKLKNQKPQKMGPKRQNWKQVQLPEFSSKSVVQTSPQSEEFPILPSKTPHKLTSGIVKSIILEQVNDFTKSSKKIAQKVSEKEEMEISKKSVERCLEVNQLGEIKRNLLKSGLMAELNSRKKGEEENLPEKKPEILELDYLDKYIPKYSPLKLIRAGQEGIFSRWAMGFIHEPFLEKINFYQTIDSLTKCKKRGMDEYGLFKILYFLPYLGAERIEHLDALQTIEYAPLLGNLAGLSASTGKKFLAKLIKRMNLDDFTSQCWEELAKSGAVDGKVAYFDEIGLLFHSQENIPKIRSGSKNKIGRGIYRFYSFCPIMHNPIHFKEVSGGTTLETELIDLIKGVQSVTGKKLSVIGVDRGVKGADTFQEVEDLGIHFVCWSSDYAPLMEKMKRIKERPFKPIHSQVSELLELRKKRCQNKFLSPSSRELIALFEQLIPTPYLQEKLQLEKAKESGKIIRKKRDILATKDTMFRLAGWGDIRVVVVKRHDGKKFALLSNIFDLAVHPIELLLFLKMRQSIENFFNYKGQIFGNQVFGKRYLDTGTTFTKFKKVIHRPSETETTELEKEKQRAINKIAKWQNKISRYNQLLEDSQLQKREFNSLIKKATQSVKRWREKLKEIEEFLNWVETGKMPAYFRQFKPVKKLDLQRDKLLNLLNDIYYVNTKRIAEKLTINAQDLVKDGLLPEKAKYTHKLQKMTPKSLKLQYLNNSGIILTTLEKSQEISIIINKFDDNNKQIIMKRFLAQLNSRNPQLNISKAKKLGLKFILNDTDFIRIRNSLE